MRDIMIDLEGMDSKRTAVIVSLGAVYFDIKTGKTGDTFYIEVSKDGIRQQLNMGRTWSLDTMIWWMSQTDEARSVFLKNKYEKTGIVDMLYQFRAFCNQCDDKVRIWGNGVDYDNVALRDCYETFDIKCPWRYSHNRCYRTMRALFNKSGHDLQRVGTHHNGLDDAISQALHLIRVLNGTKVND